MSRPPSTETVLRKRMSSVEYRVSRDERPTVPPLPLYLSPFPCRSAPFLSIHLSQTTDALPSTICGQTNSITAPAACRGGGPTMSRTNLPIFHLAGSLTYKLMYRYSSVVNRRWNQFNSIQFSLLPFMHLHLTRVHSVGGQCQFNNGQLWYGLPHTSSTRHKIYAQAHL